MALNITDFGAIGDGKTLCTESIQKAISAAKKEGTSVTVPPGTFLTGTIDLMGVSLHLEAGAVLKGSPDMKDYPVQKFVHNEMGPMRALIVCFDSENVTVDGDGVIDLNGHSFYDFSKPLVPESKIPYTESQKAECTFYHEDRPNQCIFFHNVRNLTVKGITVLDAPCWTFTFSECSNVKALGLTIDTSLNIPNDDGMHFCSCSGVIVSDCNISSGDDCLAFTGITNWEKPCENIVVSNCVIRSCSKAIVLGYVHSHVRNVLLENIVIHGSNRGLCIMSNPETGLVEHVRVKNMIIDTRVRAGNWWGNGEAVFFMALEHTGYIPRSQKPERRKGVNICDIYLDGISCMTENALGIIGTGKNIEHIYFNDVTITRKESGNLSLKGAEFDVNPCPDTYDVPENCGLYIEEAAAVAVKNVRLRPFAGEEQMIVTKNVTDYQGLFDK